MLHTRFPRFHFDMTKMSFVPGIKHTRNQSVVHTVRGKNSVTLCMMITAIELHLFYDFGLLSVSLWC